MSTLGFVAAAIAVQLALALLRRRYPPPPSTAEDVAHLRESVHKWWVASVVSLLSGTTALTIILWKALSYLGELRASRLPRAEFLLTPRGPIWWIPALFFGLMFAQALTAAAFRALLGPRYVDLARYTATKSKVHDEELSKVLVPFMLVLCAFFVGATLDCYVYATNAELVVDGFFGIGERHYQYADVTKILSAPRIEAPIGRLVPRHAYVFQFRDGSSWCSDFDPSSSPPERKRRFAEFVSERSGTPLTEVAVIRRRDF